MQVKHGLFGLVTEVSYVDVGTSSDGTIRDARLKNDDVLRVEREQYSLMLLRIAAGGAKIIERVPMPPAQDWGEFWRHLAAAAVTDPEYEVVGHLSYHNGRNLIVSMKKCSP